jgi:hypothetical protein
MYLCYNNIKGVIDMEFLNFEHESKFIEMRGLLPERLRKDPERLSVVFLMAGNSELERKITPYMDWEEGFDFEKMFENEDFSSGLKTLAKLAVVLYNGGATLEFRDVFYYLDEKNLELALNAANYRYGIPKGIYETKDSNLYLK